MRWKWVTAILHMFCQYSKSKTCFAYWLLSKWILQGRQKSRAFKLLHFSFFPILRSQHCVGSFKSPGRSGSGFLFTTNTNLGVTQRLILGRQHCLRWNLALSLYSEARVTYAMKQHESVVVDASPCCNTACFLLALLPLHSGTGLSLFSL